MHGWRLLAVTAALGVAIGACADDNDGVQPLDGDNGNDTTAEEATDAADGDDGEVSDEERRQRDADNGENGDDGEELDGSAMAVQAHETYMELADEFLRDGNDDALRDIASGNALDRLVTLYDDMVADGNDVAGVRTSQVQDVELVDDGTYEVTDCAVDQRRIYDPDLSSNISEENLSKEWLTIVSTVTVTADGTATVIDVVDEWDNDADRHCVPDHQRDRIEDAAADLAVGVYSGWAELDRDHYETVFEPSYVDRFFSRTDTSLLLEGDTEVGVRLIGADPYMASLVMCTYGFGRTLDADTGEVISSDEEWGDSRTAAEILVSGVDTGDFLIREVVQNEASDWTGWCSMGAEEGVEFTRAFNTLSDPDVVPDSDRVNRSETGEMHD